jgi:ABC-type multidrug transport system fused ATPase/permease subunit
MSAAAKMDLPGFLSRMILVPVLRQRRVLFSEVAALVVLASSQALALIISKGFLTAFFTDPNKAVVSLADLVPSQVLQYFPALLNLQLQRDDIVWMVPASILAVGILKAGASYVYNFGLARLALKVAQNYREQVFEAVLKLPWLQSAARNPGDWMTVIMADAMFIQSRLTDFSVAFVKDVVLIFSCMMTLAFVHLPAALVLLCLTPLIAWQMGRTGKKIAWYAEAFQRELGALAGMLLGMRERFRFMRAQHGETLECQMFAERNRQYLKMMTGSIFVRSIVAPGMEWFGFVFFAIFIFGWSRKLPFFEVAPDLVLQFFIALGLILKPVRELGEQVARLGETMGGLKRSMAVVNAVRPMVNENFSFEKAGGRDGLLCEVSVLKLEVDYGERIALIGEDLVIKPGKTIAVVGPSGSGKSSLLRVLAGLVPPQKWQANVPWVDLIENSAMVSQTPFLFKDTLRKNLLYGMNETADFSNTESSICSALRTVNLADLIEGIPGGLDAMFSPLDANLSGGQIQRLVIARALLRNPRLMLLDEATSAVDVASELDITRRLVADAKANGRCLISVTHRLQWLAHYDEIWFIEGGRVQEKGSMEKLMEFERFRKFLSAEGSI